MTRPVRLQLSRKRGFNLQALSRSVNGLEAVKVTRPGKWGNPFRIAECGSQYDAVQTFKALRQNDGPFIVLAQMELRGKNLACFCKPGDPCHADVLLEIANSD